MTQHISCTDFLNSVLRLMRIQKRILALNLIDPDNQNDDELLQAISSIRGALKNPFEMAEGVGAASEVELRVDDCDLASEFVQEYKKHGA